MAAAAAGVAAAWVHAAAERAAGEAAVAVAAALREENIGLSSVHRLITWAKKKPLTKLRDQRS